MKHYDPYEDPAFDPDPFDEEAFLRDVPDVWFSFSSPAWNRTEIRVRFKNVKIAVERQ